VLREVYDEVRASLVEDPASSVADTQGERERLADLIVELAKDRQHSSLEIAQAAARRMRGHVSPTQARH
jgi:hypothetical protein